MERLNKIGKGFLPFFAAFIGMFLLTFLFLLLGGFIWGLTHYEIIANDSSAIAGLYTDEAWIKSASSWISVGTYVVFIFVFGFWYKKAFGIKVKKQEEKKLFTLPVLGGCLVFGISIQIFCSCALKLILPLFPEVYKDYTELLDSMGMGQGLVPFFYMAVLAPLAEELIFRGLILKYEEKAVPFFVANFIQAFLFGIYHQNVVQFVYAFFVGMLLGYLYKKYDSLALTIVVHGIVNASGNILSYLQVFNSLDELVEIVVVTAISLLCMAAAYLFLIKSRKKQVSC